MNHFFEIITSLEYRLKAASAEAAAFKSGKKYLDMQEKHEKTVRSLEHRIKEQCLDWFMTMSRHFSIMERTTRTVLRISSANSRTAWKMNRSGRGTNKCIP